jgi:hypothetical protein
MRVTLGFWALLLVGALVFLTKVLFFEGLDCNRVRSFYTGVFFFKTGFALVDWNRPSASSPKGPLLYAKRTSLSFYSVRQFVHFPAAQKHNPLKIISGNSTYQPLYQPN